MKKLKKDLVNNLSSKLSLEKDEITQIVDTVLDGVKEILSEGSSLEIRGFGTFEVAERAEREGRNPQTGETMKIAASKAPKFKAGKALKDSVNA